MCAGKGDSHQELKPVISLNATLSCHWLASCLVSAVATSYRSESATAAVSEQDRPRRCHRLLLAIAAMSVAQALTCIFE